MANIFTDNSLQGLTAKIKTLHQDKLIVVVEDPQYFSVEETPYYPSRYEKVIFEGLAKNFSY